MDDDVREVSDNQLRQLSVDARRWRWLKMQATPEQSSELYAKAAKVKAAYEVLTAPWTDWDAIADAAIAKGKQT